MRDGSETQIRIRREALRLFVERGVDAVSMRDVAVAAGVRVGTIYVHWASREALVAALFHDGYAAYARRLAEAIETATGFQDRLAQLVRAVCALYAEDEALFTFLLLTQHAHLKSVAKDDANPIEIVYRAIAAAYADGEITAGDPTLLTAAIVGVLIETATFRHYGRIGRSLPEMADELVHLCRRLVPA